MTPTKALAHFGLNGWHGAPEVMTTLHRHNEIEMNYVTQGAMTTWVSGQRIELAVGQMMVFWGAVPHRVIAVADQSHFFWLTIPLNRFLHWQIPRLGETLLKGQALLDAPSPHDTLYLQRWISDIASQHPERETALLLEVEARLRRMALAIYQHPPPASLRATTLAEQIGRWLAEHYNEPIHVDDVAQAFHLHPHYAMRVFQQTFGSTIHNTLTQHRVAAAQRLLVTTSYSAARIANEVGFGSVSRFYAVFRQWCGQSPTHYRSRLRDSKAE